MTIRKIAVIGAGRMGSGIAQIAANSGFNVTLRSRRGLNGFTKLHEYVENATKKGILTKDESKILLSKIVCTSNLRLAVDQADLVIEAVEEDLTIKKQLFKELDNYCLEHTILASNTSSLRITDLANSTQRPDRVIGMHFFNPPQVMKLVELIPNSLTSRNTLESASSFAIRLGKTPIIARDSPGFIVNRILFPMINESAYTLMQNVANADEIDLAITLGTNHPMGPLALADLIGIDNCFSILNQLRELSGNPKYEPCPLFKEMIDKGFLGRKSGKGFHNYRRQ